VLWDRRKSSFFELLYYLKNTKNTDVFHNHRSRYFAFRQASLWHMFT
jgi:hypothetical protein